MPGLTPGRWVEMGFSQYCPPKKPFRTLSGLSRNTLMLQLTCTSVHILGFPLGLRKSEGFCPTPGQEPRSSPCGLVLPHGGRESTGSTKGRVGLAAEGVAGRAGCRAGDPETGQVRAASFLQQKSKEQVLCLQVCGAQARSLGVLDTTATPAAGGPPPGLVQVQWQGGAPEQPCDGGTAGLSGRMLSQERGSTGSRRTSSEAVSGRLAFLGGSGPQCNRWCVYRWLLFWRASR